MITSVKISTITRAASASRLRLSAITPAEGAFRIASESPLISLLQRGADGYAARVGVLDDGDRGCRLRIEFGHKLVGRVGVVQIIVG